MIDIGSNDGTSLSSYNNSNILIGVDPTIKRLNKFYRKDIIKIPEFFNKSVVKKFIKNKS